MVSDNLALELRDLTIAFGGVIAVERVGFVVAPGAIVSLIGPNGAGKTTLLNSISGFVRAQGSVIWRGQDLLQQPAYRRAELGIGRTFQNLQLFRSMTLLENVLVGMHSVIHRNVLVDMLGFPVWKREREARERAMEVLRSLHIEAFARRRAGDLPFGVQKLAGVARALAFGPRMLLLDEPAAGLSHSETETLGELISSLRHDLNLSILLVEHNMRLVLAVSDETVVLDRGRKIAQGIPAAVAAEAAVVAAYLGGGETTFDGTEEAE
jgi:branched-chain amino acid transport system ATP-binding protein